GQEGEACQDQAGCVEGLLCGGAGRCVAPGGEGTGSAEAACEVSADCLKGLLCAEGRCAVAPSWAGVECPAPPDGPPRVLFALPRGEAAPFFSLPFPNDARLVNGVVDLSGFPGLGAGDVPGALVGRYAGGVHEEIRGFSPNAAVIFRFSEPVNFETLTFGGDQPTFGFVDVTPDDPALGRRPRSRFFATTDRGRYLCHNWLGIRPSEGSPLEEGHTYAVYFRRGVEAESGAPLEPDEDFAAMTRPTPPTEPALAGAWRRYAPLRAWLAGEGLAGEDLVGATVFTVGTPSAQVKAMHAAARAAPSPILEDEILCDGGTPSPCDGGGAGRACGDVNGLYNEIHLRLRVPDYLTGEAPYDGAGGRVLFDQGGAPQEQRVGALCVAVTVPRGPQPDHGWPLVIFNHDTAEHYRSFIDRGVAARLARLNWAVLSFDRPLHGARFGLSLPPSPQAVIERVEDFTAAGRFRDLALQEVADLTALTRAFSNIRVRTDAGRQTFDPNLLAFFGHGRGAELGLPFLAFDGAIKAVVLAGAGGGVVDLLQYGAAPLDLARLSLAGLAEVELNGMHPGLHLAQAFLDVRDPVNYGALLRTPPEGVSGKHIFMLDGVGDQIAPKGTRNALAISMRLAQLGVGAEPLQSLSTIEGGVARGNARIRGADWTQLIKQYTPDEGDGHQVAFTTVEAVGDLNQFFTELLAGVPSVGP
ncbi:hypothetical protein KJ940_18170, partial [Myxococcota bacterium]|nr:hypothetical protein [Myxococcota bacterium]